MAVCPSTTIAVLDTLMPVRYIKLRRVEVLCPPGPPPASLASDHTQHQHSTPQLYIPYIQTIHCPCSSSTTTPLHSHSHNVRRVCIPHEEVGRRGLRTRGCRRQQAVSTKVEHSTRSHASISAHVLPLSAAIAPRETRLQKRQRWTRRPEMQRQQRARRVTRRNSTRMRLMMVRGRAPSAAL